jgi:uncharacterized protein
MLTEIQLDQLIQVIAKGYEPEKIILFGSYANGDANNDSDVDLLIVKETKLKSIERNREVRRLFANSIAPLDILVYTKQEYSEKKMIINHIANIADRNGKVMYERVL